MKKAKSVLLICITLLVVGLSFLIPPLIFRYQDSVMENSVERVTTELVDVDEISALSMQEKLLLAREHTSVVDIDSGTNIKTSEQACTAALDELYLFFGIMSKYGTVGTDFMNSIESISAYASLMLNSDTNKSLVMWQVNITCTDCYFVFGIDDQTGKILQLFAGETYTDNSNSETESGNYDSYDYYAAYDELMLLATSYAEYLEIDFQDIIISGNNSVDIYCVDDSDTFLIPIEARPGFELGINTQ